MKKIHNQMPYQRQNGRSRSVNSVSNEVADPRTYTYADTIVPVCLAQHESEKLISRSQAKFLTLRFEQFSHVVLDFEGVSEIGQAFGDELFRVFAREHPAIKLTPVNMTTAVEQMVKRAKAALATSIRSEKHHLTVSTMNVRNKEQL